MATMNTEQPGILPGMTSLSAIKQIGVMLGIAASIALGVYIALWSKEPPMRPLSNLSPEASMDVINYLEQNEIRYKVDANGHILVPQNRFKRIQLELSSQGVSMNDSGDETYLKKDSGFGVSQRMEKARLLRNQELQLTNTLSQFNGVKSAKVHLAIPKESSFIKNRKKSSASVLLNLYSRGGLAKEQVDAMVDLVSGSVPNLQRDRVTITDQYGRLYHSGSMSHSQRESSKELDMIRERQEDIKARIEQILTPIVGPEDYTVQVNVDMDFTRREQTLQTFNPDLPAVRSERTIDDTRSAGAMAGVPGALTNQPPGEAAIPEQGGANNNQANRSSNTNKRIEAERNYDLDTTISHILPQVGVVEKISVSVGVDHIPGVDDPAIKVPRPAEDLEKIARLIQAAIGFNAQRGDIVTVDTFPFIEAEVLPEPAPPAFYEQELFQLLLKPAIGLLLGLILIFGVLKPVLKKLATAPPIVKQVQPESTELAVAGAAEGGVPGAPGTQGAAAMNDDSVVLAGNENLELPPPTVGEVKKLEAAKSVVENNPTLAAQLVKNWIEEDG
jgi:flagellar M-ring protein FliF